VITFAYTLGLVSGRLSAGLGLGMAWAMCVFVMATFRFMGGALTSRIRPATSSGSTGKLRAENDEYDCPATLSSP